MILKAYKYRLIPTQKQEIMLNKTLGCVRFVYNWGLNEKTKAWQQDKTKISCFDLINKVVVMKKQAEFLWLSEVHSQPLQMSLRNLDNAFTNFFKLKKGFPAFKKKHEKQSFQYPQGVKIEYNKIFLPKIGFVCFCLDRPHIGEIKTVTVSKTTTGKYFVSVLCETPDEIPVKKPILKETAVGVDLGIKSFAVTSDKEVFENQKHLSKSLKRLRVEQRKLSRCVKGSKGREKQRIVVATIYERVTNQRNDFLHKFTTNLVRRYDTIVMENLSVSGMVKNHKLARSISEQGWSKCNEFLAYKCEWYGKNYIQIGRFEPSSKMCNNCGHINKELKLSHRVWECENCKSKNDRDFNASLNIRDFGLGGKPSGGNVVQ